MNKIYQLKNTLRTVLIVFSVCLLSPAYAQLSGNYTLDSTQATAGTNFHNWQDFRTALVNNGVSAAVVLSVVTDRVELLQVSFPAITNASATNTITINGNGKVIQSSLADAVILMDGADYMTFNGLVVRNAMNDANVKGFRFQNGSDYNTIKNSTIEFSTLSAASTTSSAYIAFSTSATSSTTQSSTTHGSYNTIDKNLMRTTSSNSPGPAFGIAIQGSNSFYTSVAQNNTVSNNTIQNFYSIGIRMAYTNGNQVLKNDISRANATSYNSSSTITGIYSVYSYSASRSTKIDNNNLHDWPFLGATASSAPSYTYAFYLQYNYGTATYRFTVNTNSMTNLMTNGYAYLGYCYYNYYFDVVGNFADNIDVPISTSSSYSFYGWYMNNSYYSYKINSNTIQNCDGGYYWYGIYNYYPTLASGVSEINDNLIQTNRTGNNYTYYIWNYYAQYSSVTYPTDVMRNVVKNNTAPSTSNFTYMLSCQYYGYYRIHDNIFDNNTTNYYMYAWYMQYYTNLDAQRNQIKNNKASNGSSGYYYGLYMYYNYDVTLAHNLIVDNIGYYNTFAWYFYAPVSGTYKADLIQNTVRINGALSGYQYHYAYIYGLLYYPATVNYIGNIFEVVNNYGAYMYFYNYTSQKFRDNSYYSANTTYQYWYTISSGSATTAADWVALGLGTNEKALPTGHNFASNYASNRFLNQNNVVNPVAGAKDVYGVTRNPAMSDRGAVEGFLDIAQVSNTFAVPTPMCAGNTITPTITFKNNFLEAVSGFVVACSDNGVLKTAVPYTGSIAIGGTGSITFPPLQFNQSGAHKVKFFLLAADDLPSNDTMTFNFNVLKAPGGSAPTHNATLSSPFAMYKTDGKPDITFPNEKMIYDLGSPSTVGYTNLQYGSKWVGNVTAKTVNGFNANSTVAATAATGSNPFRATLDAPKAWEDSTIEISIRIIDLVSGCDTVYKRKVLIAPKAVPDAKLPAALCERSDLIFETTSTVSSGSIDYEWNFGDGTPTTSEASPSHNFATFGQYTVVLKTTTNPHGFVTSKTFLVDITEVPTATIINTNACEGTNIRLRNATVYGGSGTINYSWDYGDGSPINNTISGADILRQYSTPGGYKVTLTASALGCSNTVTKVVYQFSKPVASFAQVSGSCLNTQFKFENNSSITLGQFGSLWDFDDAGNKATVDEPNYMFTSAGTKNVKLEVVSEFGCTDSKTIPVLVKQTPTTDYTYPFSCSRTATPFTNITNLNGETLQSFFWNFGDGFTSTSTSPIKNWTSIGPRVVSLTTYLQNGCSTSEEKIINVGVQPNVSFAVEDRCAGSDVPFTNLTTFAQGNITYTWNFGDGNLSGQAAPVHTYGSGVSQTYTVQLKASIEGGCADSTSKTVTINPLPNTCQFAISGNINAAKSSPVIFTPTGGSTNNTEYTWITGDGNSISSTNEGAEYTYSSAGKYCITMIAENTAGCECSATKCVTLNTDIDDAESMNNAVSVYPNPNSGIFNVVLAAEINSDMTVNVYNTLGELVKTITVNSNASTIDMTDFASGVYVVKVIAENQIATKKITITK